jgi:hypothetical protein
MHYQWKSHWTVTIPGKTRCVLLHDDSSKHCTCPLNKSIYAFKVVTLFLKRIVLVDAYGHRTALKLKFYRASKQYRSWGLDALKTPGKKKLRFVSPKPRSLPGNHTTVQENFLSSFPPSHLQQPRRGGGVLPQHKHIKQIETGHRPHWTTMPYFRRRSVHSSDVHNFRYWCCRPVKKRLWAP